MGSTDSHEGEQARRLQEAACERSWTEASCAPGLMPAALGAGSLATKQPGPGKGSICQGPGLWVRSSHLGVRPPEPTSGAPCPRHHVCPGVPVPQNTGCGQAGCPGEGWCQSCPPGTPHHRQAGRTARGRSRPGEGSWLEGSLVLTPQSSGLARTGVGQQDAAGPVVLIQTTQAFRADRGCWPGRSGPLLERWSRLRVGGVIVSPPAMRQMGGFCVPAWLCSGGTARPPQCP